MRKSVKNTITIIEAQSGKPARQAIIEALKNTGSLKDAAALFGVGYFPLYNTIAYLGLEIETVTRIKVAS